jgi:phosphoribosylaminoimidazolecarboxamide formyltransferase/IMP cyclohydrolase
MVVVNLYPFRETIAKPGVTMEEAIENIDIGGPTMIRSAAKNNSSVAVVTDPQDYAIILEEMRNNDGCISKKTLFSLSVKAFKHTCEYDSFIFNYFIKKIPQYGTQNIKIEEYLNVENTKQAKGSCGQVNLFKDDIGNFLEKINISVEKKQNLRYGENPHQKASYYKFTDASQSSFVMAKQLQGKELSYNNIMDGNAAFNIVKEFEKPCVSIIKHNNPCGCATGKSIDEAYIKAYEADPVSAYGSVIASNYIWNLKATEFLMDKYVEIIIAPGFEEKAVKMLAGKPNLRLLEIKFDLESHIEKIKNNDASIMYPDIKSVDGGLLIQDSDMGVDNIKEMKVVTETSPSDSQWADLLFGWQVVKNVKSNAILIVKDEVTLGVGAGQISRIDSTKIAVDKSQGKCEGAVIASDAFFPFADAIEIAAHNKIAAIIQPGGSIRDEEVIAACNKYKIAMVFTGRRHFKH